MYGMTDLHLRCVTLRLKLHDSPGGTSARADHRGAGIRPSAMIHIGATRLRYAPAMPDAISAWLMLALAGVFEIAWAYGLKRADGFTRFWPSLGTLVAIGLSFALMAVALRSIPFGTAYAVWCGIGVAGTAMVGIIALGEPTTSLRLICLVLIVTGIAGLKVTSP
jgi:quaternary ammonium compound-resistance protein SugE